MANVRGIIPQIGIQYYVIWGSVNNDGTIYILLDILVAFWGEGSDFGDSAFFWAIWSTNLLSNRDSACPEFATLQLVEVGLCWKAKNSRFSSGNCLFFGGGRWVGYWLFYMQHNYAWLSDDWAMLGHSCSHDCQVLACALLVFYRREKVGSVTTLEHGLPPTKNVLVDLRRFCRFKNAASEITWDYWKCCWHVHVYIIII